jgi:hypothetical protein
MDAMALRVQDSGGREEDPLSSARVDGGERRGRRPEHDVGHKQVDPVRPTRRAHVPERSEHGVDVMGDDDGPREEREPPMDTRHGGIV